VISVLLVRKASIRIQFCVLIARQDYGGEGSGPPQITQIRPHVFAYSL